MCKHVQEFKESHGGSDAEEAPAGRLPTNTDVVEDGEAAAREKERLRVEAIVKLLRKGISIKDRRHHLVVHTLHVSLQTTAAGSPLSFIVA